MFIQSDFPHCYSVLKKVTKCPPGSKFLAGFSFSKISLKKKNIISYSPEIDYEA
jgi:hypothetical protein